MKMGDTRHTSGQFTLGGGGEQPLIHIE